MKAIYECALCGAQYQPSHVRDWGKHAESLHVGAKPVCTANGKDHLGSNTVCRGDLFATQVDDAVADRVPAPRPIAL